MKAGFLQVFNHLRLLINVLVLLVFGTLYIKAATINVNSIVSLQDAINNCQSGDIIILANGHYTNNSIDLFKSNITVKAATSGGVFMDGYNSINISGNNSTVSGFQFTANYTMTGNTFDVYGNGNTITEMNFNGYSADKFIQISGKDNVVSYCNFQNKLCVLTTTKSGTGDMVQILPNNSFVGNNVIRYCSFQKIPGLGGDFGNECIRIGNSSYATMISRTIVEYCYFEDTGLGDSEAISVKSRENILRYNTMNNNKDAMFVFRNGDNNVAYSNFFINSGGIRVKEANNIYCYNNYFEKSGVGGLMDAVTYIYDTSNSTYTLDNINFIHNTFVDCGNINFGGTGATNGTWANNLFKKTVGNIFSNPNIGTNFSGNIYSGTLGISIPTGMTPANPQLVLNADGYYGLTATSTAIGTASSSYPALLNIPGIDTLMLDIKGQNRPASKLLKDVGCEQFTSGVITNRPLKLTDVGPSYLKSISKVDQLAQDLINFEVIPNPSSNSFTANYNLSKSMKVTLDIYNLSGMTVKSLNENQVAGNYKKNIDISTLTSGVYFVKLSTSSFYKTQKLIIR